MKIWKMTIYAVVYFLLLFLLHLWAEEGNVIYFVFWGGV